VKATVEASSTAIAAISTVIDNTDSNVVNIGKFVYKTMNAALHNDQEAYDKLTEILTHVKPVNDAAQSIEKVNRKVNGVSSNVRTLAEKVGQLTMKIDKIVDILDAEPAQ
jgi:hypothetical protein